MIYYNNNRVDHAFINNANIVAIGMGTNNAALVYNNEATAAYLVDGVGGTNRVYNFEILNFNTLGIDNIDQLVNFNNTTSLMKNSATLYYNNARNNCLIESTVKDIYISGLGSYGFAGANFRSLSLNYLNISGGGNPTGHYYAKYVVCNAPHGGSSLARWHATENLSGYPKGRIPGHSNMYAGNVLNINGTNCFFGQYTGYAVDQLNITGAKTLYLNNFNGGNYWQNGGGIIVYQNVANAYLQSCKNISTVNANNVYVNASENINYINGNYVQVNNSNGYYNITANLLNMNNVKDGNITANVNSIVNIYITNSNLNMVVTNRNAIAYEITLNDCYGTITKRGPIPYEGTTCFGSVNTNADMLVEYINNNYSTFSQTGEQHWFFPQLIQNGSVPAFFRFGAENLRSNIYYSSDYNDTNLAITRLSILNSGALFYKNVAFVGGIRTLSSTPDTERQYTEFENLQCLKYNEYNTSYNNAISYTIYTLYGQQFNVYSNTVNLNLCHNFKIRPVLNISTPISSSIEKLSSISYNDGSANVTMRIGGALNQFKQINGYWYYLNGLGKIGRAGNTSGVLTNNFIIDANTPALFIESNLDNRYYRNYYANGTFNANYITFDEDNTTNANYMFDMFKNGWRPAYNFGPNVTAVFQNVQYSQMDIYASNNIHFCYVTHWGSQPKRYSILRSTNAKIPFVTFYRTVSTWFASATNAINTSGISANGSYYNNTTQVECFNNVSLVGCSNVTLAGYKNFNYYAKGSKENNTYCSSSLLNCTNVVCNVQYTDFTLQYGSNISGNFFNSNIGCIGLSNSVLNLHNCTYTNDGCTNVTFIVN